MEKYITFIIPAYNAEAYLKKCLDSFLQSKVSEYIEVIIVDDGSSDHTSTIAKDYVKQFPAVFRLVEKENGGHGSVINHGVKLSTGKYIKVVDADDWVITENLERFITELKQCDADVVLTNFYTEDIVTKEVAEYKIGNQNHRIKYTAREIFSQRANIIELFSFHGITYKREFYLKCKITLSEKVFYEDQEYVIFGCTAAKTFYCLDLFLYVYQIGNINQSVSTKSKLMRLKDSETIIRSLLDTYHKNKDSFCEVVKQFYLEKTAIVVLDYFVIVDLLNPVRKEGRMLHKRMEEFIKSSSVHLYGIIKRKISVLYLLNVFKINYTIYRRLILSKWYKKMRRK